MKNSSGATSFGVIGLGRFGTALAISLAEAGKEVLVVDRSESKVKEVRQYTEYAFVSEDLELETLREIGIQNCDVVIVCIGEQVDVSILTTMRVVELGVPKVIAKAISVEQGAADFADGCINVCLGEAALAAQVLKSCRQAVGERIEHEP